MKCPSCGRENGDNHNFCFYCGYSFREHRNDNMGGDKEKGLRASDTLKYNYDSDNAAGAVPGDAYGDALNGMGGNTYGNITNGTGRGLTTGVSDEVAPMSTWRWIAYFLMTVFAVEFPLLMIVWLIFTFRWAFSKKGTAERRNFAKGLLITIVALIIISFIYVISLISMYGIDETVYRITNGVATSADAYMKMLYGNN